MWLVPRIGCLKSVSEVVKLAASEEDECVGRFCDTGVGEKKSVDEMGMQMMETNNH